VLLCFLAFAIVLGVCIIEMLFVLFKLGLRFRFKFEIKTVSSVFESGDLLSLGPFFRNLLCLMLDYSLLLCLIASHGCQRRLQ